MFYILYQVTNNLNGKIYVGVHKTKNLDDGYMGSGKVINSAIKKYGVENFTRVILEQFEDSTAMYAREKEVVTDEFLARDDTYNLRRGGTGGFDYINKSGLNFSGYRSLADKNRVNSPFGKVGYEWITEKKVIAATSESAILKRSRTARDSGGMIRSVSAMVSAALTDSAQQKRKETFKIIGHARGEKNSQFGSKWITNDVENKKILKADPIPDGWRAGRKMK